MPHVASQTLQVALMMPQVTSLMPQVASLMPQVAPRANIPVNLGGPHVSIMAYQRALVATKTSQKVTLLSQINSKITQRALFIY